MAEDKSDEEAAEINRLRKEIEQEIFRRANEMCEGLEENARRGRFQELQSHLRPIPGVVFDLSPLGSLKWEFREFLYRRFGLYPNRGLRWMMGIRNGHPWTSRHFLILSSRVRVADRMLTSELASGEMSVKLKVLILITGELENKLTVIQKELFKGRLFCLADAEKMIKKLGDFHKHRALYARIERRVKSLGNEILEAMDRTSQPPFWVTAGTDLLEAGVRRRLNSTEITLGQMERKIATRELQAYRQLDKISMILASDLKAMPKKELKRFQEALKVSLSGLQDQCYWLNTTNSTWREKIRVRRDEMADFERCIDMTRKAGDISLAERAEKYRDGICSISDKIELSLDELKEREKVLKAIIARLQKLAEDIKSIYA